MAAVALIVLVLPIAAFVGWDHVEQSRLDRELDAIEARGEPLDADKIDPEPVTPEQRTAARYYADAARLATDVSSPKLVMASKTIDELCTPPLGGPRQQERLATLRGLEEPYAPALELLDRAAAIDARGYDAATRSRFALPERGVALANVLRIARLACTGDGDGAASALLSTLRLRRVAAVSTMTARPFPTDHGLRSILTFTAPSPAMLDALQRAYEAMADDRAAERVMIAARAWYLKYMLPGVFGAASPRRLNPLEAVAFGLAQPWRTHGIVSDLRAFDEMIQASRQPWPATWQAVEVMQAKYPAARAVTRPRVVDILFRPAGIALPAREFSMVVTAVAQSLARTRAAIAVLAIARYRLAHAGALPSTLADLTPAYLTAPLIDPFTGRELLYRRTESAYKVYSVGPDGTDDGGLWVSASDLQFSMRGISKDIGIAVGQWPTEATGK
jgi:hypothetical protein